MTGLAMAFKIQKYKTHGHILNEVLFHFSWLLCGFFFCGGPSVKCG